MMIIHILRSKFLKINKKFQIDEEINGKLIFSSNFNGYLKNKK